MGTYLLKELEKIRLECPVVGDVRGKGLMIGIELVAQNGKDPLPIKDVLRINDACRNMGLIIGKGGVNGNVCYLLYVLIYMFKCGFLQVLRIQPPMCITKEDVDFAVAVLRKAFDALDC